MKTEEVVQKIRAQRIIFLISQGQVHFMLTKRQRVSDKVDKVNKRFKENKLIFLLHLYRADFPFYSKAKAC
jgi:hypothetical protein